MLTAHDYVGVATRSSKGGVALFCKPTPAKGMLETADYLVAVSPYPAFFVVLVGLCSLYVALSRPWAGHAMEASTVQLHYREGSRYMEEVVKNCSTLQSG